MESGSHDPLIPPTPEVPIAVAESIRFGAVPGKRPRMSDKKARYRRNNAARRTWRVFKRRRCGWNVRIRTHSHVDGQGNVIPLAYIKPSDLFRYLLTHHPGVLVGDVSTQAERSAHLKAFWSAFELGNGDHVIYTHHRDNLGSVIPIAWHGDEGRGKRRGNTAVIMVERVFAVRDGKGCKGCHPPTALKARHAQCNRRLPQHVRELLRLQHTTMKGHCMLHKFPLFIVPSSVHHAHPGAMLELMNLIALDLRQLYYDGLDVDNRNVCFATIAAKGDLKWFKKIALERCWDNQGFVVNRQCCHECEAGKDGLPYEDVASDYPIWAPTRFTSRPWNHVPVMQPIPFVTGAPEKQYKRDPFHLTKVGIYRDLSGSCVCWLAQKGYFGDGDLPTKLQNGHGLFALFCRSEGKSPALRSFSKALFTYPRADSYPWTNCKGSDTTLLLEWMTVQCAGYVNSPLRTGDVPILNLIVDTCKAALEVHRCMNRHTLWLDRGCALEQMAQLKRFILGYVALANRTLDDSFNGWGIKPKLHLCKHWELDLLEALQNGDELVWNYNAHNCEPNEDMVGRVSRLSRRLDSRRIGERVLQCCMLKSGQLHKELLAQNG